MARPASIGYGHRGQADGGGIVNYTPEEIRAGKRRLKELTGRAKAKALKDRREDPADAMQFHPYSGMAQSAMRYQTADRIEAVVVYELGKGRWYADILYKNMPAGIANVFGTPVADPLPTRAKAETAAFGMLVGIWTQTLEAQAAKHDGPRTESRIFQLYDYEYSFTPEVIEEAQKHLAEMGALQVISAEFVGEQLGEELDRIRGGLPFVPEMLDALEPTRKAMMTMKMVMLLCLRQVRCPFREIPVAAEAPEQPSRPPSPLHPLH